jgi:hypothetical protein
LRFDFAPGIGLAGLDDDFPRGIRIGPDARAPLGLPLLPVRGGFFGQAQ